MADLSDAKQLTAVDLQTIEKQGYLKKQGPSAMSGWKKRFCILYSNGRFRYYEDESLDKECNDVMLSEILEVKREKCKVTVKTTQREWRFEGEDDHEAMLWKKHFARLKRKTKNNDHFGVACEGWLHKQGGNVKNWKRRYCILNNDGTFRYYTDDTLAEQKKNDAHLGEIMDIGEEGDEFWVKTANREWRFRTEDDDDRAVWIENFRNFLIGNSGSGFEDEPEERYVPLLGSADHTLSSNIAAAHNLVKRGEITNQKSQKLADSGASFEEFCKHRSEKMQKKKSTFGLF